jgi:hypothetical protein
MAVRPNCSWRLARTSNVAVIVTSLLTGLIVGLTRNKIVDLALTYARHLRLIRSGRMAFAHRRDLLCQNETILLMETLPSTANTPRATRRYSRNWTEIYCRDISMKRHVVAIASALIFVCLGLLYCMKLIFSDGLTYSAGSFEYLLLTPSTITGLPIKDSAGARFTYSSADGPKPAITTVKLTTPQDLPAVEAKIREYLTSAGFVETKPRAFGKKDTEVVVKYTPLGVHGVKVELSNLDYVN